MTADWSVLKKLWPRLKHREPISRLTTFGVGGRAEYFLPVATVDELVTVVKESKKLKLPWRVIAGGSNVVCGDYLPGLTVQLQSQTAKSGIRRKRERLIVDANVPLGDLINWAITHNLAGLETLSGIPGSVGGAIVGNAGAYGQEIARRLVAVEIFDGRKVKRLSRQDCRFNYRESIFKRKSWLVLRGHFELTKAKAGKLRAVARRILKARRQKYHPGLRCPGSFFKNLLAADLPAKRLAKIDPAKIIAGKVPAGYLLETIGAKGLKRGPLRVAGFHGNLIINNGRATLSQVKKLADELRRRIKNRFGLKLEEEVRYMI